VANIVAKRQEQANKLLADAAAMRQAASNIRVEVDKTQAQIDAERDRLIENARKSAQLEKANLLARTTQEIAKIRGEAEAGIAQDREAAQEALIAHAGELSVEIARRLLARVSSQSGASAFVDGLCQELRGLPGEAKKALASPEGQDAAVEVVTATQLSKDEIGYVRAALERALGAQLPLAFCVDPDVIAGIEFHGRNTIVRNSWRADLDRIRRELSRDEHAGKA
jgi:F-type H+-transporting ATPase subunit b